MADAITRLLHRHLVHGQRPRSDPGAKWSRRDHNPLLRWANTHSPRWRVNAFLSSSLAVMERQFAILRLNYAVRLRYGVLVDIGLKVSRRHPIDLSMPALNCVWQGDANAICAVTGIM